MQKNRVISIFGDSILKGVRMLSGTTRYGTTDDIGLEAICRQHDWVLDNRSRFGCTVTKGDALLSRQLEKNELPAAECVYLRTLILGIDEKKSELDEIIRKYSLNWKLERISRISRAILEIALYEILEMKDIDVSVSINEAVELAKTYESEDAGAFVNGVLGGYVRSGN